MDNKQVAAATAVVAVTAFLARYAPGYLLERWINGFVDGAAEAPFGTVGETVLVTSNAVNVVEIAVPVGLGVGLGLFITGRVPDVAAALRTVAVTGAAVAVVAGVGGFLVGGFDPVYMVALGAPALSVGLLVVVGAVAGAGAVHMDLLDTDGGSAADTSGTTEEPTATTDADDDDRSTRLSA